MTDCKCGRGKRRNGQQNCLQCHSENQKRYRVRTVIEPRMLLDRATGLFQAWLGDMDDWLDRRTREQTKLWLRDAGIEHWREGEDRSSAAKERDLLIEFVRQLKAEEKDGMCTWPAHQLRTMFPEEE